MAGEIFYSQVDSNLQAEIIERAKAGFISRTTGSLDFMLGKIANIQLIAYKNQQHKELDNAEDIIGILGGNSSVNISNKQRNFSGNISPANMPGAYLNPNFKYIRKQSGGGSKEPASEPKTYNDHTILPYITGADVSLNDGTNGTTNTATVSIVIPNPVRDLDYIESTFMRPGRAITFKIEHPDSAVISRKELTVVPNALKSELPKTSANTNKKMNSAIYDMLVVSFSMSYEQNGSVTVTLHLRGTSGVYTDVSAIITQGTGSVDAKPLLTPLYKSLHEDIQTLAQPKESADKTKTVYGNIKASDVTDKINPQDDKWWMKVWIEKETTQYTYCTLGFLIEYINKNILQSKQSSLTPNAIIKFNPQSTRSKVITGIVSGYPQNVILDINDSYGDKTYVPPISELNNKRFHNFNIDLTDEEKKSGLNADTIGFPSMIWINTTILQQLTTSNVKDVIKHVAKEVSEASGGMIMLKLVANPADLNELILYDARYINIGAVTPFMIPMSNLSPSGSVVKEFSIEAKLPPSSQGLMYAINNSDVISEEQTAPFINYLYNNFQVYRTVNETEKDNKIGPVFQITDEFKSDTAEGAGTKLKEDYAASYKKYDDELTAVKQEFINSTQDTQKRSKLLIALKKKVQYPTPDLQQSNLLNAPTYPHEVTITIDGINGFRYGDAVEFPVLPARYRSQTTFSIFGINHTVNVSGVWNTTLRCGMKPDFNKK